MPPPFHAITIGLLGLQHDAEEGVVGGVDKVPLHVRAGDGLVGKFHDDAPFACNEATHHQISDRLLPEAATQVAASFQEAFNERRK